MHFITKLNALVAVMLLGVVVGDVLQTCGGCACVGEWAYCEGLTVREISISEEQQRLIRVLVLRGSSVQELDNSLCQWPKLERIIFAENWLLPCSEIYKIMRECREVSLESERCLSEEVPTTTSATSTYFDEATTSYLETTITYQSTVELDDATTTGDRESTKMLTHTTTGFGLNNNNQQHIINMVNVTMNSLIAFFVLLGAVVMIIYLCKKLSCTTWSHQANNPLTYEMNELNIS